MRRRADSAREVLRRHPWATVLLQSRLNAGPATLRHHNAVIGALRGAGFTVEQTAHAFALIDSYLYGFAMSETALPIHGPESVADLAEVMVRRFPVDEYPHLFEFTTEHIMKPGYDFGAEFAFGLNLILDALASSLPDDGATRD
jgi:hypothetical protein